MACYSVFRCILKTEDEHRASQTSLYKSCEQFRTLARQSRCPRTLRTALHLHAPKLTVLPRWLVLGVCGRGGCLADWTEKARHAATWRASGARCGTGASDGATEGVPFVKLQPEGVSMTLDGFLRTPVATAYGGSSLRSSGDTNGRWRFLRSAS